MDIVADCPSALTTVSVTVYVLASENWWTGATPEPLDPSPKSHANVPLDVDDDALKNTSSPTTGSVGENVKFADPAGRLEHRDRPRGRGGHSVSLVTLRVTVNVPPRALPMCHRSAGGRPAIAEIPREACAGHVPAGALGRRW